jgi:hypothetical protein
MATIHKAAYFSMPVPHRTGEGARLLAALARAGVNLAAFTGFPQGARAQVDFVPADPAAFLRAARRLGFNVSKRKTAFIARGADKPGAIAAICDRLAKAGINMVAMDAVSAGGGRYGAIFWVKPKDVAKAARVLRAR